MPRPNHQFPFWEFIHSMDRTGAGVDHFQHFGFPPGPPGPPGPSPQYPGEEPTPNWFTGSPYTRHFAFSGTGPFGPNTAFFGGRGGYRGRGGCPGMWGRGGAQGHCDRSAPAQPPTGDSDNNEAAPAYDGPQAPEATEGVSPNNTRGTEGTEPQHTHWSHHGSRHGPHHRGWQHAGGRRGFPFSSDGTFDLSALIESLSAHPIAEAIRSYAEQYAAQTGAFNSDSSETDTFVPPVDIFTTAGAYILHVALPGAKKEDVGVNWDAEKGELNVAGVVYRPGDEEFIKGLKKGERKVGVFQRSVKLPLTGETTGEEGEKGREEEIDGDNITAKLEDGVLFITVPRVEKDWTDVKKVDVE